MNLLPKPVSIAAAVLATTLTWFQIGAVVSLADKPPIAMARAPSAVAPARAVAAERVGGSTVAMPAPEVDVECARKPGDRG
jgi:hypothetical protein